MDTGTVVVVGPFDARDLGSRRIVASSYTVFADGSLVVTTAPGQVRFELDEWADVAFAADAKLPE
jgi:hypothetical protein